MTVSTTQKFHYLHFFDPYGVQNPTRTQMKNQTLVCKYYFLWELQVLKILSSPAIQLLKYVAKFSTLTTTNDFLHLGLLI